ncbi:MAG TPA: hypothetical protein VGZ27_04960 [Vicinamibacterales bacterium]|nr:hypothetical protein [Vicinamibacterales bacterium]
MKNQAAKAAKGAKGKIVSLRVSDPPRPECPRCHHHRVEDLFPVIPRWLACPKCGHMWSNRTPYTEEERARVLQTLRPGKVQPGGD